MTCLGALCRCQESIAVMVMCQMIHCLVANECERRLAHECMRRTGEGAGLEAGAAPEDHHAEQPCPHDRRWDLWDAQPRFESRGCGLPGPMKHCAKQMQLRSFRFLPPFSTGRGCLPMNCVAANSRRQASQHSKRQPWLRRRMAAMCRLLASKKQCKKQPQASVWHSQMIPSGTAHMVSREFSICPQPKFRAVITGFA